MSQANVETVRRFWEARNGGDLDTACAQLDPDVVLDLSRSRSPYGGLRYGHDGYEHLIREFTDGWQDLRWEAEEIIDAGDAVVVVSRPSARGMSSGIALRGSGANVFRFRDAKIAEFVLYQTKADALEAVGLSE